MVVLVIVVLLVNSRVQVVQNRTWLIVKSVNLLKKIESIATVNVAGLKDASLTPTTRNPKFVLSVKLLGVNHLQYKETKMTCPALSYVIFHIYTIISHFWILETDFDFLLLMNKTKFVEKCWIFFERSDFKISKINC